MKVLLNSFRLNGHVLWFHSYTFLSFKAHILTRVLSLEQIKILYSLYQDKRMHYSYNSVNLGSCDKVS